MDHGLVLFNVIQDSKLESLLRSFQLYLNFIGNSKPKIETYSLYTRSPVSNACTFRLKRAVRSTLDRGGMFCFWG